MLDFNKIWFSGIGIKFRSGKIRIIHSYINDNKTYLNHNVRMIFFGNDFLPVNGIHIAKIPVFVDSNTSA